MEREIMSEQLGFSTERLARIDKHLQAYIDRGYLAGINALILHKGQIAYERSFGAQAMNAAPMNSESIFRIYSMTKPITSVAALMLLEEGKFMLEDPVAKYLPTFKNTKVCKTSEHLGLKLETQQTPMTIQHLLTHMAGLSYGWFQDTPVDQLYRDLNINPRDVTLKAFVEMLADLPLVFQPGTHWRYSHSVDVLAHLIEVVADEPIEDFLEHRIFKPLGMKDTSFRVSSEQIEHLTSVYCPVENFEFGTDFSTIPQGSPVYPIDTPQNSGFIDHPVLVSGMSGGGGLVSTITDYARFAQMLLNKGQFEGTQILGRKTVELMTLNHVPAHLRPLEIGGTPIAGYGFGLGVEVLEDVARSARHGSVGSHGWGGAAMTNYWVDSVEDMVGIIMTQFMPSDFYPLTKEFRILAYQALVD
jgi:CubicO group peptidase (beta-lactamase class C family)